MIVSAVAITRKGFADELAILGASGSVGRQIAVEEEQRAIAYVEESFEISESRSGVSSAEPASIG